jgi:hypothetical protein
MKSQNFELEYFYRFLKTLEGIGKHSSASPTDVLATSDF